LFQTDAEGASYSAKAGYPKYEDVNKDGAFTADDYKIIGNPNPKFTWGLNTTMKYKKLIWRSFSVVSRETRFRNLQQSEIGDGVQKINQIANMLTDSWTPENPNASRPIIDGSATSSLSAGHRTLLRTGPSYVCKTWHWDIRFQAINSAECTRLYKRPKFIYHHQV